MGSDVHAIVGILFAKLLLTVDCQAGVTLSEVPVGIPLVIHPKTSLMEALKLFQNGSCHLAIVSEQANVMRLCFEKGVVHDTSMVSVLGIITLEDVLEELLQVRIYEL